MWRWAQRIVVGLLALAMGLVMVGTFGAIAFVHSDYGREVLRGQVEKRLAASVVGAASIGKLEGSVFDEVVLRDIAIDDRHGHPAVRIKTLRVRLALLPLLLRRVHLQQLVVEDADVRVERDPDGKLELAQLTRKQPRSVWSLELPDVRIERSRVGEVSGIELRGGVDYPYGAPLRIAATGYAIARGEAVVAITTARHDSDGTWGVSSALVAAGGAVASASGVVIRGRDVSGELVLDAPRAAAARFGVRIPDDVALAALVQPGLVVDAVGTYGCSPVQIVAQADLDDRRVHGVLLAPGVDLPKGRAGGVATFDVAQGDPDRLPIGTAFAVGWTELAGMPRALLGAAVHSDGTTAAVAFDAAAQGAHAVAGGVVTRIDRRIALVGGRIVASSSQLPTLQGTVRANLTASGALWPQPDLAVAGVVEGTALRTRGLSADSLHLAIDARHLPGRPGGSATLDIANLTRGTLQLGTVGLAAKTRADGKLGVGLTSPRASADAVVAFGPRGVFDIALGHHAVMLNELWSGSGGRVTVSPATIAVIGLATASHDGTVTLDGRLERRTRKVTAQLTAAGPLVDHVTASAALTLPAHGGADQWRSAIEHASVTASGIHAAAVLARLGKASTTQLDATVDIAAELHDRTDGTLTAYVHKLHGHPLARAVDVRIEAATSAQATHATVALRGPGQVNLGDLAIAIPRAAEGITRDAPVTGMLTLTGAPAPMFGLLIGRDQVTGGLVTGTVEVAGTLRAPTVAAKLAVTRLAVPAGRNLSVLDRLAVTGSWNAGALDVAVDGVEQGGGSLRVTAAGRLDAPDDIAITLGARRFDLAPLLALMPGRAMGGAGLLDAKLAIRGIDPRVAKVSGELHVVGGRVPITSTIGTLRKATLDATIANDKVALVLDGRLGSGAVKAQGTIDLAASAPTTGTVTMTLRKVSPIGVYQPVIDADLTAKVHRDAQTWTADIVVDNGNVVVPKRHGEKLFQPGAPAEMVTVTGRKVSPTAKVKRPPEAPTMVANITINPTHVVDDDIRGVIIGRLAMTGTRDEFGIVGSISADRGDIDLFGRRYILERGSIYYDGSTDPLLDVKLTHDFADVTTITTIRGRLSKPELRMTANPGTYTQGQLLGFLLGGEPTGDPRDVAARDRATAAGESIIANELGTYLRGNLPIGIDVLRYESGTTVSSAAVTAGSWLTHALFIAYRRHLAARPDENADEGQVEYWLGRRLSVEGTVGDHGYDGIDLLWRKRY